MSTSRTPSSALTRAAAPLIDASAPIRSCGSRVPDIGKFTTARCVWAPHRASAGTRTSPTESCSVRNPGRGGMADLLAAGGPYGQQGLPGRRHPSEGVVALVVDADERGEVAGPDLPDRRP